MAVSENKKASNAKWNAKNMATIACTMRKDKAEIFKAYCVEKGTKPNTVIRDYVVACIEDYKSRHPEASEADQEELD